MPPWESTLYTPVLGLNLCFNKALEVSREKLEKLRILAPCQLPAPRTWASVGHEGLAARAAPSGNRDVTLRSACRRSPQAQCAFVYSKHRRSAGGVTVSPSWSTGLAWNTQPSGHSCELSAHTYTSAPFQPLMTQSSDSVSR